MDLRDIIEDYEAGRLSADEALELSGCVSLVAMYQLLDQQEAETINDNAEHSATEGQSFSAGGVA
ncbi:hypothetical protein [Aureimonas sp. AU4]|uniref:hypothetical protein n=1 Tax=Aureimonas sp. AU4 TaxID=1638163 RepID=UPI0007853DAB|nr:hypothetical protein [Aureimonas sp. AU4]